MPIKLAKSIYSSQHIGKIAKILYISIQLKFLNFSISPMRMKICATILNEKLIYNKIKTPIN